MTKPRETRIMTDEESAARGERCLKEAYAWLAERDNREDRAPAVYARQQDGTTSTRFQPKPAGDLDAAEEANLLVRVAYTLKIPSHVAAYFYLTEILTSEGRDTGSGSALISAALGYVEGMEPANSAEAVLALQAWMLHRAGVRCLYSLKQADRVDIMAPTGNLAVRLMRASADAALALAKIKTGGKQSITVNHVDARNSQNVIGTVHHTGGSGGGGAGENGQQPQAAAVLALGFEPGERVPEMRSEDPERRPVPVSRGARTKALPDARRNKSRRAPG